MIVSNDLRGGESIEAFRAGSKGRNTKHDAKETEEAQETGQALPPVALSFSSSASFALPHLSTLPHCVPASLPARTRALLRRVRGGSDGVNIKGLWRFGRGRSWRERFGR